MVEDTPQAPRYVILDHRLRDVQLQGNVTLRHAIDLAQPEDLSCTVGQGVDQPFDPGKHMPPGDDLLGRLAQIRGAIQLGQAAGSVDADHPFAADLLQHDVARGMEEIAAGVVDMLEPIERADPAIGFLHHVVHVHRRECRTQPDAQPPLMRQDMATDQATS